MRSVTRVIQADTSTVWRWLTVPELMDRWISSIENLRTADGASIREGTVLRFFARGREHTTQVTEYVPETSLGLRSTQGPITANYRYAIGGDESECRLTLSIECQASGIAKVFAPIIGLLAWHTDKGQVDRLKALVEFSTEK